MPITPFLRFKHDAVEAANFKVSLFSNSWLTEETPHAGDNSSTKRGRILLVEVELEGLHFMLTEAISLQFPRASQELADRYYDAMRADGGEVSMCGWLKDKFALSWQVYLQETGACVGRPNARGAARAMAAMLEIQRINLKMLKAAHDADRTYVDCPAPSGPAVA